MISNSGSDERGAYKGGQAGDQTGREWQVRPYYVRPWNCVLRHSNKKVGICLSNLSIKAANNNKIGYDQNQRDTYWQQLQKVGYDPSKISVACEADCSAGVIANTKATGYLLGIKALQTVNATYTGNMRSGFKSAGFTVLTDSKYLTSEKYLQLGDILLNDQHHVAVYVGDGKIMPLEDNKASDSTTKASKPTVAKPTIQKGSKGTEVKNLQKDLNYILSCKLDVDGDCGSLTEKQIKAFQKKYKLEVDGIYGAKSYAQMKKVLS